MSRSFPQPRRVLRRFLLALALVSASGFLPFERQIEHEILVHKHPDCGCCAKWVEHLREHGFRVTVEETEAMHAVKAKRGVPVDLHSCHTAMVDGYVVEGHVPADVILRLLRERPDVAGLAVPGMPIGSPGMEVEGRAAEPYEVIAFERDGATAVYAKR